MALSATIVWEVRSAGNADNGGGYKTGSTGTDFSQQNAAQYALTSVTTAGADAILLHANAADDMVGNIARIVSGTNFTVGYYEIISVVAGVSITLDRTCTTAAGAAGVVNIGGAVPFIGTLGSATAGLGAVEGNLICVKKDGTYSRTTTDDTFAAAGTTTNPIRIIGYNSIRPTATTQGDGYQGRTNDNGSLVVTNMPVYTYTSGRLNISGTNIIFTFFNISASAGNNPTVNVSGAGALVYGCKISQACVASSGSAIGLIARSFAINNDCSLTNNGGNGARGIYLGGNGATAIGNLITSTNLGIDTDASATYAINNIIYSCVGAGVKVNSTSWAGLVYGNTIVGGGADGINILSGYTLNAPIINNTITDHSGFAMNLNSNSVSAIFANNYTRKNISGAVNFGAGYVTGTNFGMVTGDNALAAYADYVSPSDYNLVVTSPAVGAALLPFASIGALQRSQSGVGTTITVNPPKIQRNLPDIRSF